MLHFGADTNPWHSNGHVAEPRSASSCSTTSTTRAARSSSTPDGTVVELPGDLARAATRASTPAARRPSTGQFFLNFDEQRGPGRSTAACELRPNGHLHSPYATRKSDGNDVDLRRPRQRLARRRHRQRHALGRLGQRPANADDDLVDRLRATTDDGKCAQTGDTWLERRARHAPDLRGPRVRRRRPRRPDRQHRRRPPDRLGRRVQQLPRPVRAVRHRHRQPPGRRRRCSSSSTRSRRRRAPTRRARPTTSIARRRGTASRTASSASITQKDHGLWQDQTGGPTDPQAGQHPGRPARRAPRRRTSTTARCTGFARRQRRLGRSRGGALQVAAASLGQDAAAVFYVDQYLPVYYEILAHGARRRSRPPAGRRTPTSSSTTSRRPTSSSPASTSRSTRSCSATARRRAGSSTRRRRHRQRQRRTRTTTCWWSSTASS